MVSVLLSSFPLNMFVNLFSHSEKLLVLMLSQMIYFTPSFLCPAVSEFHPSHNHLCPQAFPVQGSSSRPQCCPALFKGLLPKGWERERYTRRENRDCKNSGPFFRIIPSRSPVVIQTEATPGYHHLDLKEGMVSCWWLKGLYPLHFPSDRWAGRGGGSHVWVT